MAAIRIIDDHLELASIGSNTHAQIDTHIAAADNYVKRDGSLALTSDWDIGDTRKILADEIRARDAAGLKLYDDGGKGLFIEDGGYVGIGTTNPLTYFHVYEPTSYASVGFRVESIRGNSVCEMVASTSAKLAYFDFIDISSSIAKLGIDRTTSIITGGARNDAFFTTTTSYATSKMHLGTRNAARLTIDSTGKTGLLTTTPTATLDINSDILRLRTAKTPATAGAAGNQGDICWDASFIYVCTATNTWKRAAIAAW